MLARAKELATNTITGFVADDVLTRAAGIAYFTLFSLGPLLFLASGIAGVIFGEEVVKQALAEQLAGMVGTEAAGTVQEMADGALGDAQGGWALAIGIGTLLLTASGAFGALQGALNAIWKVSTPEGETTAETITNFMKAKGAALGLVGTTGFLLLTSLVASAAIAALGGWLGSFLPGMEAMLQVANFLLSVALITGLFAAIYKILPDRRLEWRDVMVGAFATAVLFTIGKTAIGLYIGSSGAAEGFGAAGTLAVVLLWLYYSAVIFLLGAEFTRAWSGKEAARPEDAHSAPKPAPARALIHPEDVAEVKAIVLAAAITGVVALLRRAWRLRRAAS